MAFNQRRTGPSGYLARKKRKSSLQIGPASRRAASSNVEVSQTTYPVNREMVGIDVRERQRHRDEDREGGSGMQEGDQEPSSIEEGLYLDIVLGPSEFSVTPPLMWPA